MLPDDFCYECNELLTDEELNEGRLCFACYDAYAVDDRDEPDEE